jgi:ubiquinol-cytochrome c reductase iron-sulfur subunit
MSMAASRINLLPTARTLATGVPYAPKLNRSLPPQADSHGHGPAGPRGDVPKAWAGVTTGNFSVSMINRK